MDKSFLEKKIEEQARKEFEKEWNDFVAKMYNHPIFGKIRITIDGKEYPLAIFGVNNGIFNQDQDRNSRNQFFNFEKVKERIIRKKIESKTNDLIKQVASIRYLFE